MTLKCFANCKHFGKHVCCIGCKHLKDGVHCEFEIMGNTIECYPLSMLKSLDYNGLTDWLKRKTPTNCNIESIMTEEEKKRVIVEMM